MNDSFFSVSLGTGAMAEGNTDFTEEIYCVFIEFSSGNM